MLVSDLSPKEVFSYFKEISDIQEVQEIQTE